MATKKPLVAVFLFLASFSLLFAIFSDSGILANSSLEKVLASLEREEEEKLLAIDSLQERRAAMSSRESLDDLALSLGYNREGDVVYYFQEPDVVETATVPVKDEIPELYEGVATWILLVASLAITCLVMLLWTLLSMRLAGPEERQRKAKEKARRDYERYDW